MNNLTVRRTSAMILCVMMLMVLFAVPAFATEAEEEGSTGNTFDSISEPIVELINDLLVPVLAIVGAVGTLYCVLLGVKYAKAEEPQDREKAKNHLKSAIIGFVLIFVLMLALKLAMPILQDWVSANS